MGNGQHYDAELRDLWSRRSTLDNPGWVRLYAIVTAVLANYKPRELGGLPDEHADYVSGFYVDKVMRRDLLSDCYHAGALRVFFKNYLRDELK